MYTIFLRFVVAFFIFYAVYLTDFGYRSFTKMSETVPYGDRMFGLLEDAFGEIDILKILSREEPDEDDYIDLLLSADDLKNLQKRLDYYVSLGFIRDEGNLWRKAKVLQDGKKVKVKYKLHGTSVSSIKRSITLEGKVLQKIGAGTGINLSKGGWSLKIKHDKDGEYNSLMRRYNLISAYDEIEISTIAINKMAAEVGLIAPHGKTKLLRVNSSKIGAFMMVENHGKEWLEREYGITNYTLMKSNDDWDTKKPGHISDTDYYIQNKEVNSTSKDSEFALGKLGELFSAVNKHDVERVKNLVDMDYMAKYMAMLTITNNSHPITGDNLKYLYNHTTGRIKLIFRVEDSIKRNTSGISEFNNSIFKSNLPYVGAKTHKLFKLLLRDSEFRDARDTELQKIIRMKEKFFSMAYQVYEDNINIVMNGNFSYRKTEYLWGEFLKSLDGNINKAIEYLGYSKIYATKYTREGGKTSVDIISDSYVKQSLTNIKYAKEEINAHSESDNSLQHKTIIPSPDLDHELRIVYKPFSLDVEDRKITSLSIINAVTNDSVKDRHVYINNARTVKSQTSENISSVLDDASINYKIRNQRIDIYRGSYEIGSNLVLPLGYDLYLHPGVVIDMSPLTSILVRGNLVVSGNKDDLVVVRNKVAGRPFGVLAALGSKSSPISVEINYLNVTGGSSAVVDGVSFSGQMSIHSSKTLIRNSLFSNSYSDDGLNIKDSQVDISSTHVFNNNGDQIDLDYCTGKVYENNFYYDEHGINLVEFMDGLDVSGSKVQIVNNNFKNFTDKAISVGEYSSVSVHDNNISKSAMGVAVKDGSDAVIFNNIFLDNDIDVTGYIKKKLYPAPRICLKQDMASIATIKALPEIIHCNKEQNLITK